MVDVIRRFILIPLIQLLLVWDVTVLSQPSTRRRVLPPRQTHAQDNGFLGALFNTIQLATKNVVDNLVPNIAVPDVPGVTPIYPINAPPTPSFEPANQFKVRLPHPFDRVLDSCPPCHKLDAWSLSGTWYMVYASDNFVKARFPALSDIYSRLYESHDLDTQLELNANVVQKITNAVRMPVCPMLQIGPQQLYPTPTSQSHAAILSFRRGHVSAPLRSLSSVLRRITDQRGIYRLEFPSDDYTLDLCAISSNIASHPFVSVHQQQNINRGQNGDNNRLNDNITKIIVLADVKGTWPTCQNYVVLTNNRRRFFEQYDTSIVQFIKEMHGDESANPLQYLGCPMT